MTIVLVRVGGGEGNRKTESTSLGMLCEYSKASVAETLEDGERLEVDPLPCQLQADLPSCETVQMPHFRLLS